jgi:uncharacterized membrane protein
VWIAIWIALQRTSFQWDLYPFILLNLCPSCLAAVQGIILQISANRGDKINAAIALHTEDNTEALRHQHDQILAVQEQQMDMRKSLNVIQARLAPVPMADVGAEEDDPAPR